MIVNKLNHNILFNMKKIAFFALFMALFVISNAQKNKKFDYEAIQNDTTYYCGISPVSDSQDEAIKVSIENLCKNIADNCRPNAIYAGCKDQKTRLLDIIKTFEIKIQERMAQQPIKEEFIDEEYSYCTYIKRSDFRELCNNRKNYIERLAQRGYNSENDENLQLEEALRSYYWGMMLCLAHPYGETLKVNVNDETVNAYEWFQERIDGPDGVLKSFSFIVPKEDAIERSSDGTIITLNVRSTYGLPISNLKFQYHNGQKRIPTAVNDGKAILVLNNYDKETINISIEYEFLTEAQWDEDITKVLNTIKHNIKFKNTKHIVDISHLIHDKNTEIEPDNHTQNQTDFTAEVFHAHSSETIERVETEWRKIDKDFNANDPEYLTIMQDVEKALREKNHASVKHHFTNEGYGMLDSLSKYGNMMVIGKQDYKFIKFDNQVICRDINMQFNFKNNVSFNRDVVFRFDASEKKITSIAFRLSSVTENDIIKKARWPQETRLMLVNFLEDYQTAYALKRHDYLNSIYSDDALIIVGHVVKKTTIPDGDKYKLPEQDVKLIQYNKETYLNNLLRTFKSQDYINLRFAETDFTRATDKEVYGVRLLQEYYSTTYGDIGYLFLLVDLSNGKPLIHVRAWQPDEVDLDKLMGMKDLRL